MLMRIAYIQKIQALLYELLLVHIIFVEFSSIKFNSEFEQANKLKLAVT